LLKTPGAHLTLAPPQREDAYFFPVLGSAVLLTLFLCFKYLNRVWLNRILGGYLATMAVGGLARTTAKLLRAGMGERRYRHLTQVPSSFPAAGSTNFAAHARMVDSGSFG